MILLDIFLSCPVYPSCSTWMFKDYMVEGQRGDVGKIWKSRKRRKIHYIEGHYRLQWEDCETWWDPKKMLRIYCVLGKGSHQVHGLVGAVLWDAEFLMYLEIINPWIIKALRRRRQKNKIRRQSTDKHRRGHSRLTVWLNELDLKNKDYLHCYGKKAAEGKTVKTKRTCKRKRTVPVFSTHGEAAL